MSDENKESKDKLSRRDFLKYSAGVAAVAGATALIGKVPFSTSQREAANPSLTSSEEPTLVAVHGDELTLIRGETSVKMKDPLLAATLVGKAEQLED